MENVDAKLDAAAQKKGIFTKKAVTTVEDATAPLQQTLKNLREVVTLRNNAATSKYQRIQELADSRDGDIAEISKAERILEKLENLFE